jgi:glycosyltransferase involved in cell wall biosynthesis
MSVPDITAVITAHDEGELAARSWRSLLDAVEVARGEGRGVEVLVVLDHADEATAAVFAQAGEHGASVVELALADQGAVRNHAARLASGGHVAFLDADDLWTENWLADGYRLCLQDPEHIVAHPEANWFFENDNNLFFLQDTTDPAFDPAYLRIANPWDALCLAPRAAYTDHPYPPREVLAGYAYEDWHWNLETYLGGFVHRVVPETIHFKRRRLRSRTLEATESLVLTHPSRFYDYAFWSELDRRRG